MSWQDTKYKILFVNGKRTGQVAQVVWKEAQSLELAGEARFISNTLYKAAKIGINITKLSKAEEEKLPERIKEQRKSKEKVAKKKAHNKRAVEVNSDA